MPPVGFIAAATSSFASSSGALTLLTPGATRSLDVLLAIVVVPNASSLAAPAGWTDLGSLAGSVTYTLHVYRRIAVIDEPAQHVFQCSVGASPDPLAALLLYRGLAPGAALVASARTEISSSGTAFAAPSIPLANYSDLALLAYYGTKNPPGTFTPAGGTTQRAYVAGSAQGSLMIADYLQETVGGTPVETATESGASTGFAASIAVAALPTLVAPSIVPDVPGAIGFVTVGV